MTDEKDKKKDGAGDTPEKETPKIKSLGERKSKQLVTRLIVQFFNKHKRRWAKKLAERLEPAQRKWIIDHENQIDLVNTFLTTVTPSHGLWELSDDFMQDFVREVIERCKDVETHGIEVTPATTTSETHQPVRAANDKKQKSRLIGVMMKIKDQRTRDSFYFWFKDLSQSDLAKLYQMTVDLSDEDLKELIGLPSAELNILLSMIPEAPAVTLAPAVLTEIQLQAAVSKDFTLSQKVTDFLARNPKQKLTDFWKGIKSNKINTLESFQNLMNLPDDLIIQHLGLNRWKEVGDEWAKLVNDIKHDLGIEDEEGGVA